MKDKKPEILAKAKIGYLKKAEKIAGEKSKLRLLIHMVSEKIQALRHHPNVEAAIIPLMISKRMVQAHMNGQYKVSVKTLGLLVLGMVYFASPMDFIPDFFPLVGYTDDLSVLLAVFHSIKNEIEAFVSWEESKV